MITNQTASGGATTEPERREWPRETELALKLWVVLSRARNAVSHLAVGHIETLGLTSGEFAVMEALYHKGPLLLGEVQRKILASSGGVTYLVDKLAKRGFVERQECPTDRRAMYAVLTDAGRRWMEGAFPAHARCVTRAVAGLDAAEQEQAIALLRKLGLHAQDLEPCAEDGGAPKPGGSPKPR